MTSLAYNKIRLSQAAKMGLPIADGNEWNTGTGYPYTHSPFNGDLTPGSNFPTPFIPYTPKDVFNIKTFDTVNPNANTDVVLQTTTRTAGATEKPAIALPGVLSNPAFATWTQWIEDHPTLGSALLTGGIGLALYLLIGKK